MADTSKVDESLDSFEAALQKFEAALTRRSEIENLANSAKGEAEALRHDRVKLAQELDTVRAKATDLVDTSKKAVNKIDAAMSRIRAVLHSNQGGG
jgi:Skp family chaperone for outer membrane proteins